MKTMKDVFAITQTKVGLMFALVVPVLFLVIWMTGYQGATERLDQLRVAVVADQGSANFYQQFKAESPFTVLQVNSTEAGLKQLDQGDVEMVLVADLTNEQRLTFHVNQANAEFANGILKQGAGQIVNQLNGDVPFTSDIIIEHHVSEFSTSMLPIILGFVIYIAVMTMGIQFNLVTQTLQKQHQKWSLFWSKQLLHGIVLVVVPLVMVTIAFLFSDSAASFLKVWGFQVLLTAACISVTQMNFAIFGPIAPLVNVALIPFQLMTAGNIVPPSMLAPFYQSLGQFLPVPNAVAGLTRLIYFDGDISKYAFNLVMILIVTLGVTLIVTAIRREQAHIVEVKQAS
ncbi:ABC transporter permease [Exiguobacterium sp. ERU656]|uniref:YhgE/Pip domain-containing protein n=1 Tax=Exiguobacterium sp. ERU656 TaxID=2751217 RepID=UPI001BE97991|nr:ABC transporter permease [Exiguobacterium sp. ERU656]